MNKNKRMIRQVILVGFVLLKFTLQYLLINPEYDLHRDEFLHLDQGNHLALGYISVPPVTSWISYLINVFGAPFFWIKFFPALFGALTIYLVWKAIEFLQGDLFALILGVTCVLLSVLLRLNLLYQPSSLDVLCWTLLLYMLLRFLHSYRKRWIYLMVVVFAIGFLNKYNIVFLSLSLIPSLLLTVHRKIFLNKDVYNGIALTLLLISPNLLWQYQNHFPVFHHLRELRETQLVNFSRLDIIKAQFLFFPGTIAVVFFGLFALLKYQAFEKYRSFLWLFLTATILFLALRAKSYYLIGIYPVYFAFGSVYISKLLRHRAGHAVFRAALIFLAIACFLPVYDVSFPNKTPRYIVHHQPKYKKLGMLTWEDGKEHSLPQDFADMLGWKELAQKVDKAYELVPDAEKTLVLCDNYGQAGAINYYSKKGVRAVSFNADYINWFDLEKDYHHLIRIKSAGKRESEWKETSPFFEISTVQDSVTNPYAREFGATVFCFINAKIDIGERIKKEIAEVKKL